MSHMHLFVRRLRMAWKFKIWPWQLHPLTVKWVSLNQTLTPRQIARTRELAKEVRMGRGIANVYVFTDR
jgi:hypothetical protein